MASATDNGYDVLSWHQQAEQHLTNDPAIRQAKFIDFEPSGPESDWNVILSLTTKNEADGAANEAAVVKAARKSLVKLKKLDPAKDAISVPKKWKVIEDLPTKRSGQVDGEALYQLLTVPDPEQRQELARQKARDLISSTSNQAPLADRIQEALKILWSQVIQVTSGDLSSDDNFVKCGGDSLTAIQLSALAFECGLVLGTASILQEPSLRTMAAAAVLNKDAGATTVVEPFSLLQAEDLDSWLQRAQEQCELLETYSNGPDSNTRTSIEDAYPSTSLQEGLMGLAIKQPGSYMNRQAFQLATHVDVDRFRAAWERTLQHCTNLRTRIVRMDGSTYQIVVSEEAHWDDPSHLSTVQNIHIQYGSRLCRYALDHDTTTNLHYFIWIMHHAIFDGLSLRVVLDVLQREYEQPGTGAALVKPYSTFIKYTASIDNNAARQYWNGQLEDSQPATFPPKQSADAMSEQTTGHVKKQIPFKLPAGFPHTKATVLRAAWALLLARYSDTDDIVFGTTVSGRQAPIPGVEMISGPTISTVPVRAKIKTDQSVLDFLHQTQSQATDMIPFEQYGLRNISKLSATARSVCDFSCLLVVQPSLPTTLGKTAEESVLHVGEFADEARESYFNYALLAQTQMREDGKADLLITYDKRVLSDMAMTALSHQFDYIVQQLVSGPEQLLGQVSVASDWDLLQAQQWNLEKGHIDVDYPLIHNMISAQVQRTPHKQAVYSTEKCLTYLEVEVHSTKLALHLSSLGVTPEVVVPFCFEKSIWTIIAMLGILKAGGVFLPLDPSNPVARKRTLVQETDARLMIVSELQLAECQDLTPHVICLTERFLDTLPDPSSCPPLNVQLSPSNGAYIFFTSGSTGKPKGILIEHGSIPVSLITQAKLFAFNENTRIIEFSHYVFDVCILNIFGMLMLGGTICVPTEQERLFDTAAFIRDADVDTAVLVPSFARTIEPSSVPSLKTLVFGGEPSAKDVYELWHRHVDLLVNSYGPTEATIGNIGTVIQSPSQSASVIGKGYNCNCYIVEPNNHNRLAPIGCVGELVLQGRVLARGYINNAEQTKQAFLPSVEFLNSDSCSGASGKLYKTGDLARYTPAGDIELLGRKDLQVKLQGRRLELGEVEATIKTVLPDVEHMAVEVMRLTARDALVAFICLPQADTNGHTLASSEPEKHPEVLPMTELIRSTISKLANGMKTFLPSYMIPTTFIPLTSFPFMVSMKLDRKKLRSIAENMTPQQLAELSLASRVKMKPSTEMEARMRDLWASVLNVPPNDIGKNDNFLEIGGDSISAIELASVSRRAGFSVTVADIFRTPHLDRLSLVAEQSTNTVANGEVGTPGPFTLLPAEKRETIMTAAREQCSGLREQDIEDVFPCTALQEGLMALAEKQPGSYKAKQLYRLGESVDLRCFKEAWDRTMMACGNMRTRIAWVDGHSVQVLTKTPPLWDVVIAGTAPREALDKLARHDMRYGQPLCRYSLVSYKGHHYLAWIMHHCSFDGWSMNILFNTLARTYQNLKMPTPQPFTRFIAYTSNIDTQAALDFWKTQLTGAQRATFPPLPGPTDDRGSTKLLQQNISLPTPAGLSSITRASVLRAAWAIVLARYCDTDDICFGTTTSGRLAPVQGISEMSGMTIATVPVRVSVNKNQSVAGFLQEIQARQADMVPYEQLGMQKIAKIDPQIREACDFTSLLVIQPAQQTNEAASILVPPEGDEKKSAILESVETYSNYPLVVEGQICEGHVELTIVHQTGVVSDLRATALANHMDRVIHQLLSHHDKTLADITFFGQWDLDQVQHWTQRHTDNNQLQGESLGLSHFHGCAESCFWIVEPGNHGQLTPVGCVGELLIQQPSSRPHQNGDKQHSDGDALHNWLEPSTNTPIQVSKTGVLVRYDDNGTLQRVDASAISQNRHYTKSAEVGRDTDGPSTDMQLRLRKVWAQTLHLEAQSIGKHDSFLQLGGDSILAIHLVASARKHGIKLTVASVFQHERLDDMAETCVDIEEAVAVAQPFSMLGGFGSTKNELITEARSQCRLEANETIADIFPCTPLQQGLMALTVKQPNSYLNRSTYQLTKSVDPVRFKAAWEHTVRACQNLRTRIIMFHGITFQVVVNGPAQWTPGTLVGQQDVNIGYSTPLCQYSLTEHGDSHIFNLVLHHSIYDAWTIRLMLEVLHKAYNASPTTSLPSLAGFVEFTNNIDKDMAKSYWIEQLQGAERALYPPPRPSLDSQSTTQLWTWKCPLSGSPNNSITKATMVRAAWAIVLARHANTDDLTFGTTVSGRQATVPGLERMPGPTLATVPVRLRLDQHKDYPVSEFLSHIQSQASDMIPYEQLGIQNIAKVSRDAADACDFTSLLVIQPVESDSAEKLAGALLQPLESESPEHQAEVAMQGFFNYPLVTQAFIGESSVELAMAYDTGVLDTSQLQSLARHFEHVLGQLYTMSSLPMSKISLVSDWDRRQMSDSNRDILTAPSEACTHWRILESIHQYGDATAVRSWDGDLTYAELGVMASRLATKLQTLGVGSGSRVPICFPKSKWAVVSMVAIQIAGGAFVPLDPSAPSMRQKAILHDVEPSLILAAPQSRESVRDVQGCDVLEVDEALLSQLPDPQEDVTSTTQPDNISFIVFTSGSTGKPKGVVLSHHSVCSSSDAYGLQMGIGSGTNVFNYSAYTFDVGILDVLVTLMRGGCVCIPSEEDRLSNLAGTITSTKANWVFLTPTIASILQPQDVPGLQTVCLGGEAVTEAVIQRWSGIPNLYGGYGPAEASICAWNRDLRQSSRAANIGVPLSSAFWVVEDSDSLTLAPIDCVGELVVQGPLLANGYIGADATSSKNWIVPETNWTLTEHSDGRMYRTGDLVKRLLDGTFEYIGRRDSQVKIHGQRIEPAEIETHLKKLVTQCEQASVDVVAMDSGEALLAFIALPPGHDAIISPPEVASMLADILPSAMIPKYIMTVAAMPFTRSGKLDKRALAEYATSQSVTSLLEYQTSQASVASFQAPRTETERAVQGHWCQTLDLYPDKIGVEDNFYHLGGDSILIVALAQQILKDFQVSLPLALINSKNTTIAAMARWIDSQRSGMEWADDAKTDMMAEYNALINKPWDLQGLSEQPCTSLPPGATLFLTGGTGYLGTEILKQLIRSGRVKKVVVLVRASTPEQGLQRVKRTATVAEWWNDGDEEMIEVWTGDLASTPDLGLDAHQLQRLCGQATPASENVDAFILNGAVVNWNADYSKLLAPNVNSTMTLLRMAARSPSHPKVVYISGGARRYDNEAFEPYMARLSATHNGYTQTKVVTESVLHQLASRLPEGQNRLSVVKPGLIIGTAAQGVANVDDFIWRAAAASALLDALPEDEPGAWLHIAEVDYVASVINKQLFAAGAVPMYRDMAEGIPLDRFFNIVSKEAGINRATLPRKQWVRQAEAQMNEIGTAHPLWQVRHFLERKEPAFPQPDGYLASPETEDAVRSNVRYLMRIGFIRKTLGGEVGETPDVIRRNDGKRS